VQFSKGKILLVEDDKAIVDNLIEFLEREGFAAESVSGQSQAIEKIETAGYDLLLLDISLKEGNGYAVCTAAKANSDAAVIFLTASGDEYSVVSGFDMGADDYISKPFRPRELVSRINNVLRRTGKMQTKLACGSIVADTIKGIVYKDGDELLLSALEYRLLLVFLNNRGMVLTRNRLLQEIWDAAGEFVNDNTLTVYIKRIREKIEKNPADPLLIKTVRGIGYKMD
jgi:DNA-binding response OmpR family regulator